MMYEKLIYRLRNTYTLPPSACWVMEEAADAIEELIDIARTTATIIENEKDMRVIANAARWIPFELRPLDDEEKENHPDWDFILTGKLPDDGQRILVNCVYRGGEAVQMDEFYSDCDGSYLDSGYEIGTEATHWMPLPEPPKEET